MTFQSLLQWFGPHVATLIVAFISGFLPFVNIEIWMVAAGAVGADKYPLWTLGVTAGFGQMMAKSTLYWGAHSAWQSRAGRRFSRERVEALTERMRAMSPWTLNATNFLSALVGLPPFLLVSILAGVVRMRFWQFYATGLIGRTLRLIILVEFPHLFRELLR
jgi:membrane protein YqaA with SNARE-associated domain